MSDIRYFRLIVITAVCISLSVCLGLQALSSVSTRSAPEQSANLFSLNGLALEQHAFRNFRAEVEKGRGFGDAAKSAARYAQMGLRHDPLAPKSYAVLAMAQDDPTRRKAILSQAGLLNRRDLSLQGLILQEHLEDMDYTAVVNTLNQLLRVHPDYNDDFFPVLATALKEDEAAPLFIDILDGTAPWHERFLLHAANDEEARLGLATIREEIEVTNLEVDRRLIDGLAANGEVSRAFALYDAVRVPMSDRDDQSDLAWLSDYPPFDWTLAGENDFRSQSSLDGDRLEIFVRSGRGGVIARRIIPTPAVPVMLTTELTMRARGRSDGLRLVVRCVSREIELVDEPLAPGMNEFQVAQTTPMCGPLSIEINARALRGEPTLRAELARLRLKPFE